MIRLILLDLDGVVRIWNNEKLFALEKEFQLPQGSFFSVCFEKKLLHQAISGEITDATWRKTAENMFAQKYPHIDARLFSQALNDSTFKIDNELLNSIEKRFPNTPIVLATNATSILVDSLKTSNILDRFARIYNSFDVGFIKPDTRYFSAIQKIEKVPYAEMLFIDDSDENITAATELGINAFCYKKNKEEMYYFISSLI